MAEGIGACVGENREYTYDVPPDPQHRTCLSAGEVLHRPPVNGFLSHRKGGVMFSEQNKIAAPPQQRQPGLSERYARWVRTTMRACIQSNGWQR